MVTRHLGTNLTIILNVQFTSVVDLRIDRLFTRGTVARVLATIADGLQLGTGIRTTRPHRCQRQCRDGQ